MRTITTTVYRYDELNDKAKAKARDWWREASLHDQWWDAVYEDAITCASILDIEIGKNINGRTLYSSGFCSQGDGASFAGRYSYINESVKAIREHAPLDTTLHAIADELEAFNKRQENGPICAQITKSGNYEHSWSMQIDAYDMNGDALMPDDEKELLSLMRRFADWIYSELKKEYDYLNSDEQVEESIVDNEYEFTAEGKRA